MKVTQLTDNENQTGFNFIINITYRDIPIGLAAAAAQVWGGPPAVVLAPSLPPLPLLPQMLEGDTLGLLQMRLVDPFAGGTGTSNTVDVGDTGNPTRYITAAQVNAAGPPVLNAPPAPIAQFIYTAPLYLQVRLNSAAGVSLSSLNKGEITIWVKLFRAGAKVKNLAFGKPVYV